MKEFPNARARGPTFRRVVCLWAFLALWLTARGVYAQGEADDRGARPLSATEAVDQIMARMTPADKVGQLFVVPFEGPTLDADSGILELVHDYRVGGVILSERNRNLDNRRPTDTPRQVARLINQLQAAAYGLYLSPGNPATAGDAALGDWAAVQRLPAPRLATQASLPLWVGAALREEGQFNAPLRNGFTPWPSQLALGAAWDPAFSQAVGTILGQELRAVGINLLLGPNLDIAGPARLMQGRLATSTFGSDSWWAGQHAHAFIRGLHDGSGDRVLAFARHFPGQGGSDRQLDEELATVQGALDDLRRHELRPFARVAAVAEAAAPLHRGLADGFVTSHIRYSGFLHARERTPPISLSEQLGEMLALDEFRAWHQGGGLVMSDALGVRAIRTYYDPSEQTFLANRIANDALQAGNDLLWLARYEDGPEDALRPLKETVLFFNDQYRAKPDFAALVDAAARRILTAKVRLYPALLDDAPESAARETNEASTPPGAEGLVLRPADEAMPPQDAIVAERDMAVFGATAMQVKTDIVTGLAQAAVTLLHSNWVQEGNLLPAEPIVNARWVIFTDSRARAACAGCPPEVVLPPDLLENAVVRLFGPASTQQIASSQIASFSFAELSAVLNRTAAPVLRTRMERALNEARWILFAMLDADAVRHLPSDAVRQFLRQRDRMAAEKQIAVFAFGAPNALDATEVSKLAAYIAAYSPTAPFVDTAVRALFRDLELTGAPPVSVPGTRFSDLIERLEPDPAQVIALSLFDAKRRARSLDEFDVHLGDTIEVQAGPIADRNGHPVPDGTPVQFLLRYPASDLSLHTDPVPTQGGTARIAVTLDRPETLEIAARSIDSQASMSLQIKVEAETQAQITSLLPAAAAPPRPRVPRPRPAGDANEGPRRRGPFGIGVGSFLSAAAAVALLLVAYARWGTGTGARAGRAQRMLWAVAAAATAYIGYGFAGDALAPILSGTVYALVAAPVAAGAGAAVLVGFPWPREGLDAHKPL